MGKHKQKDYHESEKDIQDNLKRLSQIMVCKYLERQV